MVQVIMYLEEILAWQVPHDQLVVTIHVHTDQGIVPWNRPTSWIIGKNSGKMKEIIRGGISN